MSRHGYTPRAGSLPSQLIAFFQRAPDEELTTEDIAEKFDVTQGNIHTNLALAVGARVRVTSDTDLLDLKLCKWAGREGVVSKIVEEVAGSAHLVDVTFKGSKGGVAEFRVLFLEVVGAATPATAKSVAAWPFPSEKVGV